MSPEDVHIRVLRLGHAIQAGFRVGILGLRACPSILPNTWTHTHTHTESGASQTCFLYKWISISPYLALNGESGPADQKT